MAERLKTKLLEADKSVDLVVGPDAYRDLPHLLTTVENGDSAVNVLLSLDETYADIAPIRKADNRVSAFVSIMRGCDNMCSYCIVPFTRGRERSRDVDSIVREVAALYEEVCFCFPFFVVIVHCFKGAPLDVECSNITDPSPSRLPFEYVCILLAPPHRVSVKLCF